MTQFGEYSKPANGMRLQGLEALELPPSNEDLDAIAQRRDERHSDEILLAELSKLNALDYGKRRKAAAKKLGITAATLDKIMAERRVRPSGQRGPETLLPHWDVEPWHEPVAGDQLLGAIVERIRAHVVMNQDAAVAVALWVAFSWVHDKAAVHSPLLLVTSAEPNSGKSTLLGIIGFLARRSLPSVLITGPALFRSIVKWRPTFVIDEADTALVNNDDLKEVINSGWTRGQGAVRCDADTQEPRWSSTFAPKAIGMKGRRLPDTTLSRAIIVEMKRKSPGEIAQDFRHIDDAGLACLRRQLRRWSTDNEAPLADSLPEMLPGFRNRVAANWNLLLAIAECRSRIGGN
jgi:putative DNA primase/helicase